MRLAKIDEKLLRVLLINGRTDFSTLAKNLQVKEKTIWNRFHSMKKSGILLGSTIHIDYKRCGYGIYVNFLIKMDPNKIETKIKEIEKIPGFYFAFRGLRNNELTTGISVKNLNEIEKVKDKLSSITFAEMISPEVWLAVKNIPENFSSLINSKGLMASNSDLPAPLALLLCDR